MQKKTVFITGGATGIGAAAVRKFQASGWNVAFMDVNAKVAAALLAECGEGVRFTAGDIRARADIAGAAADAARAFGGIDCVVANAGIHRSNTLLDISDAELDLMIDTNIKGTVNTLREAVPYIVTRGKGSVVINASDQCHVGKPNSFAYGLTKGALGQIARSLAIDLGPKGIRVNAVCAGSIKTPLAEAAFQRHADKAYHGDVSLAWAEEATHYPLGRVGQASEVAELMYFLASDAASFITGGLYLVDGGLTAG